MSFFSPCIFPLLPVYTGILLDDQDSEKFALGLGKKVAWSSFDLEHFALLQGISLYFFYLGFGAGYFGNILYAIGFAIPWGTIIVILGPTPDGNFHFKKLEVQKLTFKQSEANRYWSAFFTGITFSFG